MNMTVRARSITVAGFVVILGLALALGDAFGSVPAMATNSATSVTTPKSALRKSVKSSRPVKSAKVPAPTARPDRSFSIPTGELTEASGCAVSKATPDLVWLHNDSGNAARLFGVNLTTKAVRVVDVGGAQAVDWEDIAMLPNGNLLIGDIGDNAKQRTSITLYEVPEPSTTTNSVTAVGRTLQYIDGPHNAEALVVDPTDGTPYVITKEETGIAGVYVADGGALRSVGTITIDTESFLFPNLITGADALPDGSGIVLRTYQFGYVLRRPAGQPFVAAFSAKPKPFALPFMIQAEAICALRDARSVFTTTESRGEATIPMAIVSLPR